MTGFKKIYPFATKGPFAIGYKIGELFYKEFEPKPMRGDLQIFQPLQQFYRFCVMSL